MPVSKRSSSLAAELLAGENRKSLCAVCYVRSQLTGEDSEALETVLASMLKRRTETKNQHNTRFSARWLSETLAKHDFTVSNQQIIRWVRRGCDCRESL